MPLNKKNFQEIWGSDSIKHPIALDQQSGWVLYRELADDQKDKCIKESTKKVYPYREKDINDAFTKAIMQEIFDTADILKDTATKVSLLLEKAEELNLDKTKLELFGRDPTEETYTDINTAGIREVIINNPEILKKVFPDLLQH